jgi:hypothetical protein
MDFIAYLLTHLIALADLLFFLYVVYLLRNATHNGIYFLAGFLILHIVLYLQIVFVSKISNLRLFRQIESSN